MAEMATRRVLFGGDCEIDTIFRTCSPTCLLLGIISFGMKLLRGKNYPGLRFVDHCTCAYTITSGWITMMTIIVLINTV